MNRVPAVRVRVACDAPIRADADYVLYWMIANRRPHWNFSLDHAIAWARHLRKPLLVLEALRCDYRWASDRFHRFVLQGMAYNQRAFATARVSYYPYVEPAVGAGKGLLAALAAQAALIVTDDFPSFFLPRMVSATAAKLQIRMDVVDSNGLLPMRLTNKDYPTAYAFRRFLQQQLPDHVLAAPHANPLMDAAAVADAPLPAQLHTRWPAASAMLLQADAAALSALPIDHNIDAAAVDGGCVAADAICKRFIEHGLTRYADARSHPDAEAESGLSPYLHFGHLSVHDVFARLANQEDWDITHLATRPNGAKAGFWGMSTNAEAFLDELITWRELGYNMCVTRDDYTQYDSLPAWARQTLAEHRGDPRPHLYDMEQLALARTADPVWNASQRQLVVEGRVHNYLRMLWGKKILEWSPSPQEALTRMIELNNRYAIDGRNPNSYSGIFWVLGRYDRPWPERPIYGKIRFMSSENTVKKLRIKRYLERFSGFAQPSDQAKIPAAPADSLLH